MSPYYPGWYTLPGVYTLPTLGGIPYPVYIPHLHTLGIPPSYRTCRQ